MKIVNFNDYIKYAKSTEITQKTTEIPQNDNAGQEHFTRDYIPALKEALKDVTDDCTLKFEKGTYYFTPKEADRVLQDFPYHNYGWMDGAFHFNNVKNITIDGGGATFVFDGRMLPFMFDHCENVTLRNFSEDYRRAWYTQCEILSANEKYTDVTIDKEKYPYKIEDGHITFLSDYYEYADSNLFGIEFSRETGSIAYGHHYFFLYRDPSQNPGDRTLKFNGAEELPGGAVRLYIENPVPFYQNSILAIQHCDRGSTGMSLDTCKNITIEDVNLYHCAGMGISLNNCTDTLIRRCNVVPAPGSGRIVSIMADAIHCINATGKMQVFDCRFESMNDDAANFHGFYVFASEKIDSHTLKCIAYHNSRTGVEAGDVMRFVDRKTLNPHDDLLRVSKAEYPDEDRSALILTFDEEIPSYVIPEMAMENRTKIPSMLHIKGVHCGKNRPRGFLISVACPTVIEDCEFYNSDTALDFTGDANYWFESGPAEDVTIKNNIFRDCAHAEFCGAICFRPVIPEGHVRFHSGVKIFGNTFESFCPLLLEAYHVKNLEFYDNKYIKKTDVYKPVDRPSFKFVDCDIDRLEY